MGKVNISEYPKDLEWNDKVFSMPKIPRGNKGLISNLKHVLRAIENNTTPTQIMTFEGSKSRITLNELCIRLRPIRLVNRNKYGWELTDQSKKFINSDDECYLAAILCANVKFLGEILFYLDTPKKSSDLQKIANLQYGLTWKTYSDINSRLLWLRNLGMVEFRKFSLLYVITDKGKEFLKNIHIYEEILQDFDQDETITETNLDISEWAIDLVRSSKLLNRKNTIGYIPGNLKDYNNTIRECLQMIQKGVTYDAIVTYIEKIFGISSSSTRSFMTTLNNMGLIERKTDILYAQTRLADLWMQNYYIIDLILIIHSKFTFILELLKNIEEEGKSYRELAVIAKISNYSEKENVEEIRKRIILLKSAKLVKNVTMDKFMVTKRGADLLKRISFLNINNKIQNNTGVEEKKDEKEEVSDFLMDLRMSMRDSGNYERLEKNVAKAFEYLGFNTKWIGGSGNTDVLIQTPSAPKDSFSVSVDAKSTQTGNVTDGTVDFDTLIEHRKKHKTEFSAIVGGKFENERLIRRAIEHKVVLIDMDSLEKLILDQKDVPIRVSAYRKIFEHPGLIEMSDIQQERDNVIRRGKLLHAVMDCLVEESDDPITEGLLQERDIYRSLRNNREFDHVPTLEEISDMLNFLSSPLIGCVKKIKDEYYAIGSVSDASKIFEFYMKACQK